MKIKLLAVALICFATSLQAQTILKGVVTEAGSHAKLMNVFVKDNTNKQITLTDKNGNFEIRAAQGHLLVFSSPGYVSDTLYVIDMAPKRIQLAAQSIALREVNIKSTRQAFDPRKEYPEVYTRSKVYPLSPSSWFSKDARDARRLKHYFLYEAQQRHIDEVFTIAYVGSIVPLKGQELEDFMTLYRPTYAFIRSNNTESLAVYINDSYKKFKALPPDKRSLPRLTTQ